MKKRRCKICRRKTEYKVSGFIGNNARFVCLICKTESPYGYWYQLD